MPSKKETMHWIQSPDTLSFEEIYFVAWTFAKLGVKKIRITGGEPLLRHGIEKLVHLLSSIPDSSSLDMTTNGYYLSEKASMLRSAGLRGITISLHSTRRERFSKITGFDGLGRVLEGIDAAIQTGFDKVKLNAVAIRGYNSDEILDLVEFARKKGIAIRFIEFMPLDGQRLWRKDMIMTGAEIHQAISKKYRLIPKGREMGETATIYGFEDEVGDVGLITPLSLPFCDDCDRIRLTADGKLLTCLFDSEYYDLKPFLRNTNGKTSGSLEGKSNETVSGDRQEMYRDCLPDRDLLADYIRSCVAKKPPGIEYSLPLIDKIHFTRSMHAIGG